MAKVIDKDFGWDRINKEIRHYKKSYTKVGVQEGEKRTGDGDTDMVLVAAANEFGTSDGRIPERPFMRQSVDENDYFKPEIEKLYDKVLEGKLSCKKSLAVLGEHAQKTIQKRITDLKTPPNAPSTIKKKGSSNPLIDSGQMRASIRHIEVIKGGL